MGLRGRLLLLVLVPTIPALILAIYTSLKQRQFGMVKVEKDAVRLVQVAALEELSPIEATRQHLTALARFPEARGTNLHGFDAFFGGMRKVYTDYTDFGLIETNGDLVACSYGGVRPTNLAQRAFFRRVLLTNDFSVGAYEPGVGAAKPSLVFGYPVLDNKGQLARVVYAALDLDVLSRAVAKTPLPMGWIMSVLDQRGRILARYPAPEKWVGQAFAEPSVLQMIKGQKEGTTQIHQSGDVPRLCAFTSIGAGPTSNLFASVGILLSLAYAETRRMLILNLTVLGAVAALALVAAWFYGDQYILRPVKAMAESTRQVTQGDLSARTGIAGAPGELNDLAQAFDRMAESLQAQRCQNERLHAELEDRVKQRTAQLEHSNQELEAFSYSVSHDLRAPLRHIHGHVGRLQDELGPSLREEDRRVLKLISDAAKRMGTLIDNLLAFSRMGRVELARCWVSMDDLVQEVLQEVQRDTNGRKIHWSVEPLPRVFADSALLKQVWVNLLSNAVKYTRQRDGAEIKISSRACADELEFRVQDNGAGFDMRYADKLFRVFERLHRPEDFEGTGIGLANVRRIILRHGGRTWAEGSVNAGAIFYFTLPRITAS